MCVCMWFGGGVCVCGVVASCRRQQLLVFFFFPSLTTVLGSHLHIKSDYDSVSREQVSRLRLKKMWGHLI